MRRLRPDRLLRRLTVVWRGSSLARQTFIAFYSFTVIVTAITFMLYIQDTRDSVIEMERATMTSMFPVIEKVITDAMLRQSRGAITHLFSVHNHQGADERMFLLDSDKMTVNTQDLAAGAKPRRETSRAYDPDKHIVMDFPIQNRSGCVRCHGANAGPLGYVRLVSPKRDRQVVAEANLKGRLIILFSSFLIVGLWTLIVVRRVIDEPMGRIISAMHRVARGALDTRVDDLPSGELRSIARGFNNMVRLLEKDRREIVDLHRSQVAHLDRLAALGELSAHLAHEVRNPLTGISSAIQVMQLETPVDSPRREVLGKVLVQLNRMEQTMGNFLRFARMPEAVLRPFELREPLERVLDLVEARLRTQKIEVKRDIAANLPRLKGDPGQIEQVFLNLFINAANAMPRGGTLSVSARAEAGGSLLVEVRDTGKGIPGADLERVFRPFFTTRENGSGLGLPLSRQIIVAHDGEIWIESVPDRGTSVFVRLPAAAEV
ncbi:MAG: HAMP domain-containing protein [Elusimicrobia bacterium]|nr:HAMP domain-containing protein [Elusimicrobiota bacterium]